MQDTRMLRLLMTAALVLTALFATANMALSREWEAPGEMDEGWQVVFARMVYINGYPGYVMNLDGSDIQPLMVEGGEVTRPDCSPDGNHLAFSARGTVFTSASDGHALRPIHPDAFVLNGNVTVSDNGSRVVFRGTLAGDGVGTIMLIAGDFVEIEETLPRNGQGGYPSFEFDLSPDGSLIAYRDPSYSLYVVNLDRVLLTQLHGAFDATWSPEGILAFAAKWDGANNIYIMDVDRSVIKQLTYLTGELDNSHPAWSPDGNQILYTYHYDPNSHFSDLYVMNADGSDQRPLTDPITPVTWACFLTARPTSLIANP